MKKILVSVSLLSAMAGAPLAVQASELDGLYGGFHLGYSRDSSRLDYQTGGSSQSFDLNGGLFGIQFGYNESITRDMMAGIEADYSMANIEGEAPCSIPSQTCSAGMDWITSLRLRLGWQGSNLFVYGLGGVAYAKVKVATASGGTAYPDEGTEQGWVLGGGAEMALSKSISAKLEVSKTLFNSKNMTVDSGKIVQTDMAPLILKAGINFRFR